MNDMNLNVLQVRPSDSIEQTERRSQTSQAYRVTYGLIAASGEFRVWVGLK